MNAGPAPESPVLGLDHLHLRSPDPDSTARFFTELLGGRQIARVESGQDLRVNVDLAGVTLLIDRSAPDAASAPSGAVVGLAHLGLATARVDALVERLRRSGVEIVLPPREVRPGLRVAFVKGPEGLVIEFLQKTPQT